MSDDDHEDGGHRGSLFASGLRLAMKPAKAIAGSVGIDATAERTIDELAAGPLPEMIGRSLREHHVVERVVAEMADGDDLSNSLVAALESERTSQVVDQVLASPALASAVDGAMHRVLDSPEFERVLRRVLTSPEVRHALTQQSSSLAGEAAEGARRRAVRLDAGLERGPRRWLRRPTREEPSSFGGFASRGIALVVDAVVVTATFVIGAALVGLVASLVGHLHPEWLVATLVGAGWFLLSILYFVGFWTTAGQTPGMRLMHLHVVSRTNAPLGLGRSCVRLVGLWLAIIPCFAGFLPALVDDRRRALEDFLAGTVVVYEVR